MSFSRENIIWQSRDGTWNRGFYEVVWTDPYGDPEWDVEYGSGFDWIKTGLASEEEAAKAWTGANPGGYDVLAFSEGTAEECDRLDAACVEDPR